MTPTDLLFPRVDGPERSSLPTGRAIVADAARAVDPALAQRIAAIDDWHDGYVGALAELTVAGARDGRAVMAIAAAGLASVSARLVLARDGEERPLAEAFTGAAAEPPRGVAVRGSGSAVRELAVPWRGARLTGDALRRRLERWVHEGVIEPTCAEAVGAVIAQPDWLRLEGRRVALAGAGAEIGPLELLSAWGAEVVALDVPGRALWKRILATARDGAGIVHVPLAGGADDADVVGAAGLDLTAALPAARAWLAEHAAAAPLVLADHAYADGAAHVRVAAATRVIAADLILRGIDVTPAFLGTPTDCYLVPAEVVQDALARGRRTDAGALLRAPLRLLSGGRLFTPAYRRPVPVEGDRDWGLADALVVAQGPNYALAKRIQRWGALVARDAGHPVSFNVAPPTRTRSVTKNRLFAAVYGGAGLLGVEVFAPATTRALMAALLVHDLHRPERAAAAAPEHPDGLFATGAAHGGFWRLPYDPRSVLGLAAIAGLPRAVLPGS